VPGSRVPRLDAALAYRNDEITHKFTSRFAVSDSDAEELFTETKRMLWVSVRMEQRQRRPFTVEPALRILDEMWHTFVLFTREYHAYCRRVFGRFLHHAPRTMADDRRERSEQEKSPAAFVRRQAKAKAAQLQFIRDVAGEETLLKWYVELPLRYDGEFFRSRSIPISMSYQPPKALVKLVKRRR
jgi:hypothetical protein